MDPADDRLAHPTLPADPVALAGLVADPLTAIRGHAQLAVRDMQQLPEPERRRLERRLQLIDDAVNQVVRHVRQWSERRCDA